MVRKVVMPATISVRTVVLFSLSLKSRSSIRVLPDCSRVECAGIALCKASCPTDSFLSRHTGEVPPKGAEGEGRKEDFQNSRSGIGRHLDCCFPPPALRATSPYDGGGIAICIGLPLEAP